MAKKLKYHIYDAVVCKESGTVLPCNFICCTRNDELRNNPPETHILSYDKHIGNFRDQFGEVMNIDRGDVCKECRMKIERVFKITIGQQEGKSNEC